MDYSRIYRQIIEKFRAEQPIGYSENHHIVPRCIGGNDDPDNLVRLPPRYHLVAHLCLARIHGGKLIFAAFRMITDKKHTSRSYEWLRRDYATMRSKQVISDEQRAAISKALTGRKASTETRKKLSKIRLGNQNGKKAKGIKRPDVSLRMLGNKFNVGRKHTAETRAKVAAATKKRGTTSEMAKKSWETRRKNGSDKLTPEHIAKLKASRGDMTGSKNPMHGRKHSAETKAKMAIKAAARMQGNQNTKGMRFKKIDGKMIRIK